MLKPCYRYAWWTFWICFSVRGRGKMEEASEEVGAGGPVSIQNGGGEGFMQEG